MRIWIILFIGILVLSGSIAFFLIKSQSKPQIREVKSENASETVNLYTNLQYGFAFAFPQGYSITQQTMSSVELRRNSSLTEQASLSAQVQTLSGTSKVQLLFALCRRVNRACLEVDRQVVVVNTNGVSGIKYFLKQTVTQSALQKDQTIVGPIYLFDLPFLQTEKAVLLFYASELYTSSDVQLHALERIATTLKLTNPTLTLTPSPIPLSLFPEQPASSLSAQ